MVSQYCTEHVCTGSQYVLVLKNLTGRSMILPHFCMTILKRMKEKSCSGPHSFVMRPCNGSQFIIFGPLFSSYHSLVRCLTELKGLGYLSNDMKIAKPSTFIVFNGDVIDGSPYILETLSLVLSLMHANSGKLFLFGWSAGVC